MRTAPTAQSPRTAGPARVAGLVALAVAGLVIVSLPDSDARLFSFSDTHGPSALDAVGVVLLLAAWLPLPVVLVRHRRLVPPAVWAAAGAVSAGAGALLVTSIRTDAAWWWAPVVVLVAVQIALVGVAVRRREVR